MSQAELQSILNLSKDEKIELVQLLWDNISEDKSSIGVLPHQMEELERRLIKINNGTADYKTWNDIKKKY